MPSPVLMYSRPPAIRGVFCDAAGARRSLPPRVASGMVDCRHTISRSWTDSASIWSRGTYLELAASAA